ncbi:MAG: M20 family metallo-hydrolase [Bacteroidetes bacterium]|nr:M20 family metallo-hydrolase [Bacteroidota bacterium]
MQDYHSKKHIELLKVEVLDLLRKLIQTPSFSKQENATFELIKKYIESKGIPINSKLNNVWCINKYFDTNKPTILLNSHHDTVKPNPAYTNNPFQAYIEDGKLYGLGSNDAGGPLVSLLATFIYFYDRENLKYNMIFSATAEEEISGNNGIACILNDFPKIDFAVVGEPTAMQMATTEKGLMVLDCKTIGKPGHAAREEGENAIYKAMSEIEWFKTFEFERVSDILGKIKMSVTLIQAGEQHNIVPAECSYTVDVRTTEVYTNEEVLDIIKKHIHSEITPRSFKLQPSSIDENHAFVLAGKSIGRKTYGSPTTSDQALMPYPSLKMGPGDSARSHSANEYIYISEIKEAIDIFIHLFKQIN